MYRELSICGRFQLLLDRQGDRARTFTDARNGVILAVQNEAGEMDWRQKNIAPDLRAAIEKAR